MARRQKANPGLVFADRNNVLDDSDDDLDDEPYQDSDSDDDEWSQPSGDNENDHGYHVPPDDDDAESTDDDPGDPVDDDSEDGSSDDESTGDFDIGADHDDDSEPTLEEVGVNVDEADDPESIAEGSGVPDGNVEENTDDPSEGTASVEDQGVGDEVLVQHADEMDARYGRRTSKYNL
jgi:hypothetical protein